MFFQHRAQYILKGKVTPNEQADSSGVELVHKNNGPNKCLNKIDKRLIANPEYKFERLVGDEINDAVAVPQATHKKTDFEDQKGDRYAQAAEAATPGPARVR